MTQEIPKGTSQKPKTPASQSRQSNFSVHLLFAIVLLFILAMKYVLYFQSPATEHGLTAGRLGATLAHLLIWGLAYSMCVSTQKKALLGCLAAPTLFFGVLLIPALGFIGLIVMGVVHHFAKRHSPARRAGEGPTRPRPSDPAVKKASERITWWSDAPTGWPALTTDPLPSTAGAPQQVDTVFFAARLKEAVPEGEHGLKISSLGHTLLTTNGILDIPFEVDDSGVVRSVFFFPGSGERESGWAEGIRRLFEELGKPAPVFFSPRALQPAEASPPLRTLQPGDFSKLEGRPAEGTYSMWWKESEPGGQEDLTCVRDITRFYEFTEGVESYLVGLILHALGVTEQPGRQALPEDEATLPMIGPEGMAILMSLSVEKGVRFHIREEPNNVDYRNSFWSAAAALAQETRSMVDDQCYPLDERGSETPLQWWEFNLAAINHIEEDGDEIQHIGSFTIG